MADRPYIPDTSCHSARAHSLDSTAMITPMLVRPFRWITALIPIALIPCYATHGAKQSTPRFNVIGFFTGKQDQAHISFLREAEVWFPEQAVRTGFHFDTTSNWANLNADFL